MTKDERRARYGPRCDLMDVHSSLSHLVAAAQTACEGMAVSVYVEWRDGTYLTLVVECRAKYVDAIAYKLQHGLLDDYNDYRFTSVQVPLGLDPDDDTEVRASPDMSFDMRLHERIPPMRDAA